MTATSSKGRKIGRAKVKGSTYRGNHTREKNKVRRIIKYSAKDAEAYAKQHAIVTYYNKLVNKENMK